jgi:hypothetical protein
MECEEPLIDRAEDFLRNIVNAQEKGDCVKREFSQCDCPLCKEGSMSEEAKVEETTADGSILDKGLGYIEDGLKTAGKATGKVAWYLLKPLDQVHKHVIEPFTDAFGKAFTDGK